MNKVATQGLLIVVFFFTTLYIARQFDWMTIFRVHETTKNTKEKLGELYLELFKNEEPEIENQDIINAIDSIVNVICSENWIKRESVKVHILDKDDVNAFALPDGHLIIYSGLILACDNQNELTGVLCHEIAHIELNHVMKKLVKEIGFSVLISMTTGSSGTEAIKKTPKCCLPLHLKGIWKKKQN